MPNGLILRLGGGRNQNFNVHYGAKKMRQSEFNDVKGEFTLLTGKVHITSLNPHSV